ncbi:MAG: hypothetical protein COB89_06540 [Piscirickettsiaceae bacterium]|nr:MAG: hypothetical protein COB89_06540 [Piscirickettsiaceae bacterium]
MQLNKHSKLAILLAPFLIVAGYIASDQYEAYKLNEQKIFSLSAPQQCNIFKAECILTSGNMQISLTNRDNVTKANTSFPVDSVVVSLVYNSGNETVYLLNKMQSPQYWARETDIKNAVTNHLANTIRILVKDKGSMYLSELPLN